jgi:CDP-diacylglycerol--glycerol-3-phosphate 3-phosphatidyltransferase
LGITENIDDKKVLVTGRVFTVSNFISFSRVIIAFPIIYSHYANNLMYNTEVIILILYGIISDYLDGLVARKTNTISEVGKIIDPISDKLCAGALFIYTVYLGWVPIWFLVFFIVRDALIIVGSSYIKIKYGKVAMSTMSGKISINVIAAYWMMVFFFRESTGIHELLLWMSVTIMVISFLDYFNRYRKIMRGANFN